MGWPRRGLCHAHCDLLRVSESQIPADSGQHGVPGLPEAGEKEVAGLGEPLPALTSADAERWPVDPPDLLRPEAPGEQRRDTGPSKKAPASRVTWPAPLDAPRSSSSATHCHQPREEAVDRRGRTVARVNPQPGQRALNGYLGGTQRACPGSHGRGLVRPLGPCLPKCRTLNLHWSHIN